MPESLAGIIAAKRSRIVELRGEADKIEAELRDLGLLVEWAPRRRHVGASTLDLVEALRRAAKPMRAVELAHATSLGKGSIGSYLCRAAAKGAVVKIGRGLYGLPEWSGNGSGG